MIIIISVAHIDFTTRKTAAGANENNWFERYHFIVEEIALYIRMVSAV